MVFCFVSAEADELAGWVLQWIDACMPIAASPAETGCSNEGRGPDCKDSSRNGSWNPAAEAVAAFSSGVAAAQKGMQPEAAVYTSEIYALLRRRLLRIRACSHQSSSRSKIPKPCGSRSATASPPHSMQQGSHRSSSPSTEDALLLERQQHEQYVTTAASAPAAPDEAHSAAASGPGEGKIGRNPKPVATSICPSPARSRSCTTDTHAAKPTSHCHKQQNQQHNGAAASAAQRSPSASAAYAGSILDMIKPLLVSEEEAQLESQVRTHDLLLLQRQQQHLQHVWQPQQPHQQRFSEQLADVLTPSQVSITSPQKHQPYNGADQALQQQLLLLQEEERLLQLQQQQSQQQADRQSFEQLMRSQMLPEMPHMQPPKGHPVLQANDTETALHREMMFLHQKEQQLQQRRLQLLAMTQATAAATAAAKPRRSGRRVASPRRRQLSMRRRQQQAGVFAAVPPKSSSSSRSPSSRVSTVKEEREVSPQQCRQQASETKAKPPPAERRSRSVAAKPAAVGPRYSSPQQHQEQEQRALRTVSAAHLTKQQQEHLQEQQQHLQEQQQHMQEQHLQLQKDEQQQESEKCSALDL